MTTGTNLAIGFSLRAMITSPPASTSSSTCGKSARTSSTSCASRCWPWAETPSSAAPAPAATPPPATSTRCSRCGASRSRCGASAPRPATLRPLSATSRLAVEAPPSCREIWPIPKFVARGVNSYANSRLTPPGWRCLGSPRYYAERLTVLRNLSFRGNSG